LHFLGVIPADDFTRHPEGEAVPSLHSLLGEVVMTPLRQRFVDDLRVRNYSPRTVEAYVAGVARFAKHFGRSPDLLGPEEVRAFQVHLIERKVSWSQFNQTVCALRFLYGTTLQRPDQVPFIPFGKRPKKLPCVLSPEEVVQLFAAADPGRDCVLLQTTYACGLRLSDVIHLEVSHIDSARMVAHIHQGKGRKDRLVPLSLKLLEELRVYWRCYRPQRWLFPNRAGEGPSSEGMVQHLMQRVVARAGIGKPASLHTLRHSFATHMLEAGVDVFTLQKILGHRQLSTTARYLHLRSDYLRQLPSLLDLLPVPPAASGRAASQSGSAGLLPGQQAQPGKEGTT
jgi:site-specific recombinase XerD